MKIEVGKYYKNRGGDVVGPIGVQSNPLTADRLWRDEIALRLLPGLLSLGSDLEDADLPNGTQGEIAVKQAFYIADVFLKAAKQS